MGYRSGGGGGASSEGADRQPKEVTYQDHAEYLDRIGADPGPDSDEERILFALQQDAVRPVSSRSDGCAPTLSELVEEAGYKTEPRVGSRFVTREAGRRVPTCKSIPILLLTGAFTARCHLGQR